MAFMGRCYFASKTKTIFLYLSLGNGYIEGTELDGFLREFVASANATDISPEVRVMLNFECLRIGIYHYCSSKDITRKLFIVLQYPFDGSLYRLVLSLLTAAVHYNRILK